MPRLVITADFEDASDMDFARSRMVGAVEDVKYEMEDEERFDGKVDVGWEIEDDEEEN